MKRSRLLLLLAVFGVMSTVSVPTFAQTWTIQNTNSTNDFRSVHFVSDQKGFVGGQNGTMVRTSNAGITWELMGAFSLKTITDIFFLPDDASKGWATSTVLVPNTGKNLSISTNGGTSWSSKASAVSRTVYGIHIAANKGASGVDGWIVGEDSGGQYFRRENGTSNNFATLVPINGGSNKPLRGIHAASTIEAIAVGDNGTILKSGSKIDAAWTAVSCPVTSQLNDVFFVTNQIVIIVGHSGVILRSTNGGSTWVKMISGTTGNLYAVNFATATKGWAVGANGVILRTTNAGLTWAIESSNTGNDLYDICFVNDSNGWAVGDQGTILKYGLGPSYSVSANTPCRDDTLFLSVNGNTGDAYVWSGPNGFSSNQKEPWIPNIQFGGNYSVIITQPSGTTASLSVTVTLKESPEISLSNVGALPCGSAGRTVYVSSLPVGADFSWFDAQSNELGTQSSYTFQDPGSYSVRASKDGCSSDVSFIIGPPLNGPSYNVTTLQGRILTCVKKNLNASVQVNGNVAIQWIHSGQVIAQTPEINIITPGGYTIRMTDTVTLCYSEYLLEITENKTPPEIGTLEIPVIDCSTSPKKLVVTVPVNGIEYRWFRNSVDLGAGTEKPIQVSGAYSVVATDPANGCTNQKLIQVPKDDKPPMIQGFAVQAVDCDKNVYSLCVLTSFIPQDYVWTRGGIVVSDSAKVVPINPGNYSVTVTGSNACTSTSTYKVNQSDLQIKGTIDHILEWQDCNSGHARIFLTLEDMNGEVSWRDQVGVEVGSGPQLDVFSAGTFVAMIIWESGCQSEYIVDVVQLNEDLLPTVITPNGDGENDQLIPNLCFAGSSGPIQISVFNRWGYVIYRSEDYKGEWPGSSAETPSSGQYYYILRTRGREWRRPLTILH